ncbi:UPF0301 protein [Glycine max]|nr:UPF0301 protein [Glycine max]
MWHLSKFIHWPILLRHPTWIRCLCLFYFILFLKNRCRCCRKHYVVQIKPHSPFIFIPPKSRLVSSRHFISFHILSEFTRNSTNMEACFLSHNSFTKTTDQLIPTIRNGSLPHHKRSSQHLQICDVIIGCHMSSPSPFGDDDKPTLSSDWRSFRAKLVAGEQLTRHVEEVNDLDTVVDHPPLITIGDKWAHVIHEPENGCLLIATEKLDGVHIFERTVILLLSTGPLGPSGIILNRPSLMSIKETRSTALDVEGTFSNSPLFFGGPLEEGIFLLSPKEGNGGDGVGKSGVFEEVMKGLYYGAKESVGCAAEMVKRNAIGLGDFRFFDGYCGWEKEQLRDEIRAGYWTVAACSPSVVGLGSVGSIGLWDEVLGLMSRRKVM